MITIELPPDLEEAVSREAEQKGTTVELLALDALKQRFQEPTTPVALPHGVTLVEALSDYIGAANTKNIFPEGSTLSENTGRKFAVLMKEKRKQGRL